MATEPASNDGREDGVRYYMDRGKEKGASAVVAGGRRTLYRGPGREQLNTMGSAVWTANVSASAVLDRLWRTGNLARGSEAEITRWHRPWRGCGIPLDGTWWCLDISSRFVIFAPKLPNTRGVSAQSLLPEEGEKQDQPSCGYFDLRSLRHDLHNPSLCLTEPPP